ncbi:sensor domain-containing diguanylate cyclase [Spirochaetia bacterium 38H-sp]|uniref:diguanylate cyclase n=1 Tax=Rarispira pelagica TaxID=3141764 RepID=A0ABU9UC20_9SPIR
MGKNSLKKKIFGSIVIIASTFLILFGLTISIILYKTDIDSAWAVIRQRNLAMKHFILGYFMPLKNTVQVLSEDPIIKKGSDLTEQEKKYVLGMYKTVKALNPNINYVYSAYKDKTLLINDYTPPPNYDPTIRPWYRKAVESHPDVSDGIPYEEIKDKTWLVSLGKTITDRNNNIVGVIAVDAKLNTILELISKGDPSLKTSYSYVINRHDKLILHHRKDLLNRSLDELITPMPRLYAQEGKFEYSFERVHKIAYYNRLDELGWILITVANKEEILTPIVLRTGLILIGMLMAAMIAGRVISTILTNNLVEPLHKLEKHVKTFAETGTGNNNTEYPNNEIGRIAKAIQNITDKELYKKNQQLKAANAQLEILSVTDPLTGLFNRRKILKDLNIELYRAKRYNSIFSVIIFDIDHFKAINDTFGHTEGDIILKELGDMLKTILRTTDTLARWGGEEFILLCPETGLEDAINIAEKFRRVVETHIFSNGRKITISLGVAGYRDGWQIEDIIRQADNMLYKAKSSGRNRVEHQ